MEKKVENVARPETQRQAVSLNGLLGVNLEAANRINSMVLCTNILQQIGSAFFMSSQMESKNTKDACKKKLLECLKLIKQHVIDMEKMI